MCVCERVRAKLIFNSIRLCGIFSVDNLHLFVVRNVPVQTAEALQKCRWTCVHVHMCTSTQQGGIVDHCVVYSIVDR